MGQGGWGEPGSKGGIGEGGKWDSQDCWNWVNLGKSLQLCNSFSDRKSTKRQEPFI